MKNVSVIGVLVSSVLILSSAASFAQQGPRGDHPEPQDIGAEWRGQTGRPGS